MSHSDVDVEIRSTRAWYPGSKLSKAETRHHTGQGSYQEADDSRWSSSHFGQLTSQDVHASSRGAAHTQGH